VHIPGTKSDTADFRLSSLVEFDRIDLFSENWRHIGSFNPFQVDRLFWQTPGLFDFAKLRKHPFILFMYGVSFRYAEKLDEIPMGTVKYDERRGTIRPTPVLAVVTEFFCARRWAADVEVGEATLRVLKFPIPAQPDLRSARRPVPLRLSTGLRIEARRRALGIGTCPSVRMGQNPGIRGAAPVSAYAGATCCGTTPRRLGRNRRRWLAASNRVAPRHAPGLRLPAACFQLRQMDAVSE
jgi:hypothetical protein